MEYAVIRHGNMDSVVVFMKALDDGAVYFKNKAGTRQWIINLPTSNGRGGDIAFEIRKQLRAKGLTAQADEINKAAQSLLSVIKHTDESSDDEIIIDEGVEIIDAPYPEHGKAQILRRCFICDDEDGYPEGYEGYIEHHGILGMKWGVRRYQNADGSLTDEGRKHYGSSSKYTTDTSSKLDKKKAIAKYGHESWQMQRQAKKALKKGDEKLAKEYNKLQKESRDKQKELRSQFADERVARYGKNTSIAGEFGKEFVRSLSLSVISTGSAFLLGPLSLLLTVPISAISLQSSYVAARNIVDIADSNKIPKEDKYREKEEKKKK